MASRQCLVLLLMACAASGWSARAAEAPLAGCYERVYDAAHLKAHPGQIVRRAQLQISKTSAPQSASDAQPIVADGLLAMWVGKAAFSTFGACYSEGESLICNASLSAEEKRLCKTREDGVRDCRVSMTDPGSFRIAQKTDGLLVTVRERLELPGPESGPYLYLDPDNAENRVFLLQRVPDASCK